MKKSKVKVYVPKIEKQETFFVEHDVEEDVLETIRDLAQLEVLIREDKGQEMFSSVSVEERGSSTKIYFHSPSNQTSLVWVSFSDEWVKVDRNEQFAGGKIFDNKNYINLFKGSKRLFIGEFIRPLFDSLSQTKLAYSYHIAIENLFTGKKAHVKEILKTRDGSKKSLYSKISGLLEFDWFNQPWKQDMVEKNLFKDEDGNLMSYSLMRTLSGTMDYFSHDVYNLTFNIGVDIDDVMSRKFINELNREIAKIFDKLQLHYFVSKQETEIRGRIGTDFWDYSDAFVEAKVKEAQQLVLNAVEKRSRDL